MDDPLSVYLKKLFFDGKIDKITHDWVTGVLEPFYQIVRQYGGKIPPPRRRVGKIEALKKFTTVMGKKRVKRVILVPYTKPINDRVDQSVLWDYLKADRDYRKTLDALGEETVGELFMRLTSSLGLNFSPQGIIGIFIFFFLILAVAGKEELASRFEPWLEILPHCIPLGEKVEEPGTWVMIVAQ